MHDIKFIKDNSSLFDQILKKRNISALSEKIIILHNDYLDNLKKTQVLQEKKNLLSKGFSSKLSEKDLEKIKKNVADIKNELDELKKKQMKKKSSLIKFFLKFQI